MITLTLLNLLNPRCNMIGRSVAAWSYWSEQLFTEMYWIASVYDQMMKIKPSLWLRMHIWWDESTVTESRPDFERLNKQQPAS